MKRLIAILFLLLAAPALAMGPEMLLEVFEGTKYDISSFETGNDGWTFAYAQRINNANYTYSAIDGGAWGLARVEGPYTSTITKTITTAAGEISLWHKSFNTGESLTIDGSVVANFPTNGGVWTRVSAPVTAGSHTIVLTMSYQGIYDYIMIPVP